jgi:hypothetical protein
MARRGPGLHSRKAARATLTRLHVLGDGADRFQRGVVRRLRRRLERRVRRRIRAGLLASHTRVGTGLGRLSGVRHHERLHRGRGLRSVPGRHVLRAFVRGFGRRRGHRVRQRPHVHVGDDLQRRPGQRLRPERQRLRQQHDFSRQRRDDPADPVRRRLVLFNDVRDPRRAHGHRGMQLLLRQLGIEDVPAQRVLRRMVVRHGDRSVPGPSVSVELPLLLSLRCRRRRRHRLRPSSSCHGYSERKRRNLVGPPLRGRR